MKTKMDRKGQVSIIPQSALVIMLAGIILVVGLVILAEFKNLDVIESGSDAEGALNDTNDAFADFSGWLPIITIVIVAGVVITIVVRSLMFKTRM